MSLPEALASFLRRWRRLLWALGGLYALWLLVGFFLLPGLLRARIERFGSQFLHRPVTVGAVRFNPIVLTAEVRDLKVPNRDGSAWITLRRLYLDYRLRRLVSRTIDLATLELDGLTVRVDLDGQGRLNFQDLLEGRAPAEPATQEAPSRWAFAIGRLLLREGQLTFTDRSQEAPFRTALGPVDLQVDGIRTEVGHQSGLAFEAWTEAKEHLSWTGTFSLEPLASTGRVRVDNLVLGKYEPYTEEQVASQLRGGTATFQADYRFAWGKARREAALHGIALSLKDLKVAEGGAPQPALELPLLELSGGEADLLKPSIAFARVAAERGLVRIERDAQGGVNLQRLAASRKPKTKESTEPLALRLEEVALRDFRVAFSDAVPARPVTAEVTDLDLDLKGFSLDPQGAATARLALKVGEGSLKVDGTLQPFKVGGDLAVKIQGFDLAPWDPYLDGPLALRVGSGRLGLDGRLRFSALPKAPLRLEYAGSASLQQLELRDQARNEPFLRWKQLRVEGAALRAEPLSLKAQRVAWTEPEGRVVMEADGSTNVARALKLEPGGKPPSVPAAVVPATPTPAPDLAIPTLELAGGRLTFIDRSVQPAAALVLSDLSGSYLGLSNRPDATSKVEVRGRAGGLAPILISGRAMPLRSDLDTDVALTIQGADLTDFTPYTGKYLGYTVQKGKLILTSRLRIDHRKLDAENAVKLDQFYLGDKVESPDATGLPVKLGLAILRDRKGVIAFDLPIQGSLDDPDIKYGRLVWKAIFGLLGKIATSPFTLLGKLVGGDSGDLSSVAFAPGVSALDAAGTAKLQALAKALAERPALRLEAEGAIDPDADGAALRRAGLETLLRRTRMAALKQGEEGPVPPAERVRWLKAAYDLAFPATPPPKGTPAPPTPPPAEQEQRLLGTVAVDPAALAALADARAKAVVGWLLDTGKADPTRVFQVRTGQAKGAQVAFSLK